MLLWLKERQQLLGAAPVVLLRTVIQRNNNSRCTQHAHAGSQGKARQGALGLLHDCIHINNSQIRAMRFDWFRLQFRFGMVETRFERVSVGLFKLSKVENACNHWEPGWPSQYINVFYFFCVITMHFNTKDSLQIRSPLLKL